MSPNHDAQEALDMIQRNCRRSPMEGFDQLLQKLASQRSEPVYGPWWTRHRDEAGPAIVAAEIVAQCGADDELLAQCTRTARRHDDLPVARLLQAEAARRRAEAAPRRAEVAQRDTVPCLRLASREFPDFD